MFVKLKTWIEEHKEAITVAKWSLVVIGFTALWNYSKGYSACQNFYLENNFINSPDPEWKADIEEAVLENLQKLNFLTTEQVENFCNLMYGGNEYGRCETR